MIRVGTATTADKQYVWGLRYIDDLVLSDKAANRYYYCQDANFNVVAALSNTGAVQERYAYTPYGVVEYLTSSFGSSSSSSIGNEFLYTGRRLDPETGLYQYRHRYYHAPLGRFVTRDWIVYADGMNMYEYVHSRPTSLTDPYGLAPVVHPVTGAIEKIPRYIDRDPWTNHGGLVGEWYAVTWIYCDAAEKFQYNQWLKCACEVSDDIDWAIWTLDEFHWWNAEGRAKSKWFKCTRSCLQERWWDAMRHEAFPSRDLRPGSAWQEWACECTRNSSSKRCCELQVKAEQTELQDCMKKCGKWSWGFDYPIDWIPGWDPNDDFNDLASRIEFGNKRCCEEQ